MKLAVLQHHQQEHPGLIRDWAQQQQIELVYWHSEQQPSFAAVTAFDGVIVLGGEYNVKDRAEHPWMQAELAWLQQALDANRPIVAICLGAQMLAHLLGSTVKPLSTPEFGAVTLTRDNGQQLQVLQAHHYHVALPQGATLHGSTALCAEQIYHHAPTRVLGLQCHLEWTQSMYQQLIGPLPEFDHRDAQTLLFALLDRHFKR
ncbi:type 1 glutamine amidotransferase [uncultured Ferrimonas sp.]|uniref:type 1 glutamine amidotransferase n=1 Tax=uncultured Ferrimonas sp. TaxID=432640 RepID=UPI00261D053E|nr:type 1 glutamine amidotransferase [uncultured Ferrimonas sp.]